MKNLSRSVPRYAIAAALATFTLVAGCSSRQSRITSAPVPEIRPGFLAGYLQPDALPDALALLPPPPAPGTIAAAQDEDVSKKNLALRGTPRWALAAKDVNIMFPVAADIFLCALGAPVTEKDTPHLYMLMRRTLTDSGRATYKAKQHYHRTRPFAVNRQPICVAGEEERLLKDGAYPSGHSSIGWAWALILTEVAPDRIDAILARGRAFGQSRVVCNVHWQSDVVEGRSVAAGVVARLHADPAFRADLEAAKTEFAAARTKGPGPVRDCAAEAAALAEEAPSKP